LNIRKVFPVVSAWWKKRERSTDIEKRCEERVYSVTQNYHRNISEQTNHIVYNKKGIIKKK